MLDKNTSHLAGEFLVAGELARRGYPVSITMGKAKGVDIYAETRNGLIKVEAKAIRHKSDWPINSESVEQNKYYVFVFLGSKNDMERNKSPIYFVARGAEISEKIQKFGTMEGIRFQSLDNQDFKERWDKF